MRVFLAGAAGGIGRRLVPLLLRAGHDVTGTTRSAETASELARTGVVPAVLDVFDAQAVTAAIGAAKPAVVTISSPICRANSTRRSWLRPMRRMPASAPKARAT